MGNWIESRLTTILCLNCNMLDHIRKKFLIELLIQIGVSIAKNLFRHVKPIKPLLVVNMPLHL